MRHLVLQKYPSAPALFLLGCWQKTQINFCIFLTYRISVNFVRKRQKFPAIGGRAPQSPYCETLEGHKFILFDWNALSKNHSRRRLFYVTINSILHNSVSLKLYFGFARHHTALCNWGDTAQVAFRGRLLSSWLKPQVTPLIGLTKKRKERQKTATDLYANTNSFFNLNPNSSLNPKSNSTQTLPQTLTIFCNFFLWILLQCSWR